MESNQQSVKIELDEETSDGLDRELERYRSKWKELEERGEKLLVEIKMGVSDIESFARKFMSMQMGRIGIENEVKVLKQANLELEKKITDLGKRKRAKCVADLADDEGDKVTQLMIETNVLECEKRAAESLAEDLKLKCQRLEMENSALRERISDKNFAARCKGIGDSQEADTPLSNISSAESGDILADTPLSNISSAETERVFPLKAASRNSQKVRKQLTFGEEVSTFTKMAPSTPGIGRPFPHGVVDISDSEDDQRHDKNGLKDSISNHPFASSQKRRRASNIIDSDNHSNDEDDDNVPIGKLRSKQIKRERKEDPDDFDIKDEVEEFSPPRRRLRRKYNKKVPEKASPGHSYEILNDEELEDGEDETGSNTESETLGGFIVSGSDSSESDVSLSAPEEVLSDDDVDYKKVISKIRRKKEKKVKWEFEADMLADFAKDINLCMKAVCALYRKQTEEEKCVKQTILSNGRGFSQCDATRGSILAEFLCDGEGDICKTVEELREFNPEGPQLCRTLAIHYSKQLFEIYKNGEDPLFLP